MIDFWNARYAEDGFAYGTEPNAFFRSFLDGRTPGRLLLPGEGEGRNAVYAASMGWQVDAFDYSPVARGKALRFAAEKRVEIHYWTSPIGEVDLESKEYDLIALLFVHLPPDLREAAHRMLARHLAPGGRLAAEFFSKQQIEYGTGGPKNVDMLYGLEDLRADFSDLAIDSLEQRDVSLTEGKYHAGTASVIRLIARRS